MIHCFRLLITNAKRQFDAAKNCSNLPVVFGLGPLFLDMIAPLSIPALCSPQCLSLWHEANFQSFLLSHFLTFCLWIQGTSHSSTSFLLFFVFFGAFYKSYEYILLSMGNVWWGWWLKNKLHLFVPSELISNRPYKKWTHFVCQSSGSVSAWFLIFGFLTSPHDAMGHSVPRKLPLWMS